MGNEIPMPLAVFPKCFLDQLVVEQSMSPEEWIEMAASLDVDGLEFFSGFTPAQDPPRMKLLRERAREHGLAIPMMCHSPDFTQSDEGSRHEEIERQKAAIEACADLGGTFCRVLSGQRRPEVGLQEGIGWAADSIRACIPYAAERGVTLILENHYKDGAWLYPEFAQKMNVFLALLEAVGEHPNFGVNYDPSNAIVAGDDPIRLLQLVKHRVVTMHASDRWLADGTTLADLRKFEEHPSAGYAPILKHGIIGRGLNDYDRIFSILKEAGFEGWIIIEDGQEPETGMEHLRLSAEFLRSKMRGHGLG